MTTYNYDELVRLISVATSAGTVAFTYDNRCRLTAETDVFGQITESTF